jgi:pSer/pThr/pTyr-binding forkhead associated (FHA) protein
MAFLIIEKGKKEEIGLQIPLGENSVFIGRATTENQPDISLHDECVSRRHAEITYHNNCFYLRDLRSTNGTMIDEQRIEPGKLYPLKKDSVIGLGIEPKGPRVLLRFKAVPTVSTTRLVDPEPDEAGPTSWLIIDNEKGEIHVNNQQISLPRKEYDLLLHLYRNMGKIISKDELISAVWPEAINQNGVSDAAIDQLVHRLRLKIESNPSKPEHIISRKGFGFMLV